MPNAMMTTCRLSCIYLALSILTAGHCLADEGKRISPGEAFAKRLIAALESIQSTQYQHKTDIDEDAGRYHCDCSGLLGYFLRQDHPEAYLALTGELAPWRSRALAATFYETFDRVGEEGDGLWQQVPNLLDAEPGDLMAWRKPELVKGKSTGHVVMIASKPVVQRDGRVRVRVIDSTTRPHDNDTRGEDGRGLGAGDMWFAVDKDGRPIAYHSRRSYKPVADRPIAIGRLQTGKPIPATKHQDDRAFINLSEMQAAKLAKEKGLRWRVIALDGKAIPIGLSRYAEDRVNAVIVDGRVVRVRRG